MLAMGLVGISQAFRGSGAPSGFALGVASGTVSVVALAGMVRMIAHNMGSPAKSSNGAPLVIALGLTKFPILVGVWWFARTLGTHALAGFGGGLVLVYSLLVGWAATRNAADP